MDIYYRDTKTAMDNVNAEAWDFLHEDLTTTIFTLTQEVDGLLDQYENKVDRVTELEDLLEEHGIEVPV